MNKIDPRVIDFTKVDAADSGVFTLLGLDEDETIVQLPDVTLTPFQFGAKGDGVADDTAALNAMFAEVRSLITASQYIRVKVDLNGGVYKVTGNGVNATGMTCWNLEICNGVLLGHTTGKAVLDVVGLRGYTLNHFYIWGDKTDRPARAIQMARPTSAGFCGSWKYDHVIIDGYFSDTAFYGYGFEGAKMDHCTFFNRDPAGRAAIFEGFDEHPITSEFSTVMTGDTSFILNKIVDSQFRYLPIAGESLATITGATKANPCVITCAGGHPFVNGQNVCFLAVGGMTELNTTIGLVGNATSTTFELTGQDSSAFGAYTSGGAAIRRSDNPPVYLGRAQGIGFDGSYIVSYGQPHIELGFHSSTFLHMDMLDFGTVLFEGAGHSHNVLVKSDGNDCVINGFKLSTYNSHVHDTLISIEDGGTLLLNHPYIESVNPTYSSKKLFDVPSVVSVAGGDILYMTLADVEYTSLAAFSGDITDFSTGKTTTIKSFANATTFTPTVTSSVGTITTLTATARFTKISDHLAYLSYRIGITTNGTGSGSLLVTLPSGVTAQSAFGQNLVGNKLVGTTDTDIHAKINATSGTFTILNSDGSYPGADGAVITFSGVIELS